jgi:two-component system response regulator AtoC
MNERSRTGAHRESQFSEAIRRIAASECPILVTGESGVGKGSVAELLHALSPRSAGPLRNLRAADVSGSRVASALSGAGTVLLTGVADLTLDTQGEVIRRYAQLKVENRNRLISTATCDLVEAVREGRMREDFYYFISAVSLRVPPLRHRKDELILIAEQMLEQFARKYDRPKPTLSPELRAFLLKHTWPGNLVELESSMKTCVAIGDPEFSLAALQAALPKRHSASGSQGSTSLKAATRAACIRVERQLIADTLRATDWNRKQTAKALRISYKTLLYKLKQSGLTDASAPTFEGVRS